MNSTSALRDRYLREYRFALTRWTEYIAVNDYCGALKWRKLATSAEQLYKHYDNKLFFQQRGALHLKKSSESDSIVINYSNSTNQTT